MLRRNTSSRPSPPTADASRDPDNVPAKAGNQTSNDVIELSLDSGSRPAKRSSSGMTGSANCDIVSKGRRDFCRAKLIGVYINQSFLIFLVGSMSSKVTPAIFIVLYSLILLRSAIYLLIKSSCPFIIDNFSFVFASSVLSDNRST